MKVNRTTLFMVIVSVVLLVQGCVEKGGGGAGNDEGRVTPDLKDHPVYSAYDFGHGDDVIDVGIQPIAVPIGVTGVLLSRDNVLRNELARQGIDLRLHPFLKGADLNYFLARGDLEAGMGGDMPAVTMAAVSGVLVTSLAKQGHTSFVTKAHMLLRDIKGKRIGYPYGSNAHYSLLQALTSAGINESDVHLIELDVNEMPGALADDRIDMFVAWEPVPTLALATHEDFAVIHRSLATSYLYFASGFAKRNMEPVRQIVASQVRSMRWINADRTNLIKACRWKLQREKDFTGRDPVLSAEETADLYHKGLLGIRSVPFIPAEDLLDRGRLYREFHFLKKIGKIPGIHEWQRVRKSFDNSVIKHVIANPEKYRLNEFSYRSDGNRSE